MEYSRHAVHKLLNAYYTNVRATLNNHWLTQDLHINVIIRWLIDAN